MHCLTFPADQRHAADFDQTLLQQAAAGGPIAAVWQAHQSLVVPRTYQRFAAFEQARQTSAAGGWPVVVRQSGGGLVPQGGGIVNFSLAQRWEGAALTHTDAVYQSLCRIVVQALRRLSVDSHPAAVPGSFCDGRYNLAVETPAGLRKIAGTAQVWRRIPPTADKASTAGQGAAQVVLAHAVILADIDATQLTHHLNAFEDALGSSMRYQAERVISVRDLYRGADVVQALTQALSLEAQTAMQFCR